MKTPTAAHKKQLRLRQEQLVEDRRALLTQPAFCRVMHEIIADCGVFRLSFAGADTHSTAFNEGQKNVGLRLIADLETATPDALSVLRTHAQPAPLPEEPDDE